MKMSSYLRGRIQTYLWRILAVWALFTHFFEYGKSGRFTGVSGGVFRETGADSGLDWGWGSGSGEVHLVLSHHASYCFAALTPAPRPAYSIPSNAPFLEFHRKTTLIFVFCQTFRCLEGVNWVVKSISI
jgi:hypothetical protein